MAAGVAPCFPDAAGTAATRLSISFCLCATDCSSERSAATSACDMATHKQADATAEQSTEYLQLAPMHQFTPDKKHKPRRRAPCISMQRSKACLSTCQGLECWCRGQGGVDVLATVVQDLAWSRRMVGLWREVGGAPLATRAGNLLVGKWASYPSAPFGGWRAGLCHSNQRSQSTLTLCTDGAL